jgi:hypothetical protein
VKLSLIFNDMRADKGKKRVTCKSSTNFYTTSVHEYSMAVIYLILFY